MRLLAGVQLAQHRRQILAAQILHGQEVAAVDLAEVVDLHDVLVVRAAPRCAPRSRTCRRSRWRSDVVGADALEHEGALEALHAVGDRAEHLGHPARADALEQDVPSESLTVGSLRWRHWLTCAPTVSRSTPAFNSNCNYYSQQRNKRTRTTSTEGVFACGRPAGRLTGPTGRTSGRACPRPRAGAAAPARGRGSRPTCWTRRRGPCGPSGRGPSRWGGGRPSAAAGPRARDRSDR